MSKKLRESFVEHPRAILFLRISGEGVFQHPQPITRNIKRRPYAVGCDRSESPLMQRSAV
jgi:hypothetical protein